MVPACFAKEALQTPDDIALEYKVFQNIDFSPADMENPPDQ